MAGQVGTKFQINYKLNNGTLINLYADTVIELETGLADLAMNALNINKTGTELGVNAHAAPVTAPVTVSSVAAAFNATPVQSAPATSNSSGNSCKHGAMKLVTGTSTKGPWSAYMCSMPKGSPDKCEPIWLR